MDLLYGLRGVNAENTEDAIIEDEIENKINDDISSSSSVPGLDTGRMPTSEELLNILDEMTGLSDEDKESLRDELTKNIRGENNFGKTVTTMTTTPFSNQAIILFALLAIIALIFVFFGYKLYKSLIERERKREEKKKLKQMKKKK